MLPKLVTEIPGPRSRALATRLRRHESQNITYVDPEFPVFWERAAGTNVWDADGNRFLDLTSGFAVAGLGFGPPEIVEAIRDQAGTLYHAMGDVHPTELKVLLCEELSAITFERWDAGSGKCVLASSGSEAVEAALKTAFIHTKKRGVIAFEGAYHGLGYGALETSGMPYFREPFLKQLADFAKFVPFPQTAEALPEIERQIRAIINGNDIGAILVEPLQGRAGEIVPPLEFLPILRRICDENSLLLVVDEIYTGFNRTGKLFACDHFHVIPDLICLGKGLTSGFPLSACVAKAEIMDSWPESSGEALHTSTFLGNPLGCRMALASIALHRHPATEQLVFTQGNTLKNALQKILPVRGLGLMIGMEIVRPDGSPDGPEAIRLVKTALRDGLLFLAGGMAGNVLSFTPPFAISDEEIRFVADWLGGKIQTKIENRKSRI
ncbi:MAG TPA: aspartate aminotransferase family protein [Chthoniobacterales bacterium]